jgi:hypothetical protein
LGNAKRSCSTILWVVRWRRSAASLGSHQGPSRPAWLVDAPPSPAGSAPTTTQFTGRRLSMNDLQARLDRAADELTPGGDPASGRGDPPPRPTPPAAACRGRRGGGRHRGRALGTWGRPVQPGASGTVGRSRPGNPDPGSHATAGRSWAGRRCHPAPNPWAPGAAAGPRHPVHHPSRPWAGLVHLQRGNHQG